jgi:hypothetical protein
VEFNLNGLLDNAVYISGFCGEDGRIVELNAVFLGRYYIGQTDRSVDIRLKEHQRHIRLEHPDKSAVAEQQLQLQLQLIQTEAQLVLNQLAISKPKAKLSYD